MSLSQERPTNPSTRSLELRTVEENGVKRGTVRFYDKELQKNVEVPVPFEFIVLDQLATVKGWSDADESGYWSNEVRSVARDVLTVRTSKGPKESGLWKDIKNSPSIAGARYHASIYLAHKSGDGMEIANLILKGAALNAWIEFTQKNRTNSSKVILSGWEDGKKGAVTYKIPVFEAVAMTEDEKNEAIELDKRLQEYFKQYFNYSPDDANNATHSQDVVLDDIDDEVTIDLADIPF